jgi:hypothetical protein
VGASAHLIKNECILVVVGVDGRILTSISDVYDKSAQAVGETYEQA